MYNRSRIRVVLIAVLLLLVSDGGFGEEEEGGRMQVIDAAKKLFSLSSASDYSWIAKVKGLFRHGPLPNLDFRDEGGATSEEGTTEKVREAVVKSLDKGKAAVEDSAKSAAEFAEVTVHKTVKQIKKTFSGKFGAAGEL